MKSLVKQYRINEAYSLQQYEGKVRDAIVNEIKELNKNAILVCLFLYRFKMFMTSRTIHDRGLNCSLTLIYYDVDSGIPKEDYLSGSDYDYFVGPDSVDGATANDKVMVYVPITLDSAPFATGYMNEYCTDRIYKSCTKDLNLMHCIVNVDNYNSIRDKIKSLKDRYYDNIENFIDSLPDECVHARKTINADINYILKTVFHELTHVLDYSTAATVNHFTGIGIDNVDKHGLELALNVLYMLWSRTEFNAFTQTFGRDIDRPREVVKSNYINKVSVQYLSRPCSDGGNISFDEFLSSLYDKLNELSDVDYDDSFWEAVKTIVANGSNESSAKERFSKMTPQRFRNYFIRTSVSLIEKLKDKVVKNIAAQNSYDKDISNIASSVKDAFNKFLNEYDHGDILDVSFDFDCYFKKLQESYRVYVNVETVDLGRNKTNDNAISNNSVIHITVKQLYATWDLTPQQLFGKDTNAYSELYKELMTRQRKTKLDRLYINFAEDLNYSVNKLMNK